MLLSPPSCACIRCTHLTWLISACWPVLCRGGRVLHRLHRHCNRYVPLCMGRSSNQSYACSACHLPCLQCAEWSQQATVLCLSLPPSMHGQVSLGCAQLVTVLPKEVLEPPCTPGDSTSSCNPGKRASLPPCSRGRSGKCLQAMRHGHDRWPPHSAGLGLPHRVRVSTYSHRRGAWACNTCGLRHGWLKCADCRALHACPILTFSDLDSSAHAACRRCTALLYAAARTRV